MTKKEFISAINATVVHESISSVEKNLVAPPGRQPSEQLIKLSHWFNGLNEKDKSYVKDLITESVEMATFSFLCVLDGVRAIDNYNSERENLLPALILKYKKGNQTVWLNDPEDDYLHDLF
jgi:hypothetical protein